MIENSSFEQTSELNSTAADKRASQEGMMGMALATTFHAVLLQCSPKIFEVTFPIFFIFQTYVIISVLLLVAVFMTLSSSTQDLNVKNFLL